MAVNQRTLTNQNDFRLMTDLARTACGSASVFLACRLPGATICPEALEMSAALAISSVTGSSLGLTTFTMTVPSAGRRVAETFSGPASPETAIRSGA